MTEDHPEVKAMVLQAVEEAKQTSTPRFDLHADVLFKHIKEVCQRLYNSCTLFSFTESLING